MVPYLFENMFMVWATELNMWDTSIKNFPFFSCQLSLFCYLCLFGGVVYWFEWLKSEETRHVGNLTLYSFNLEVSVACGRTIHSHNSLEPPLFDHIHRLGHILLKDGTQFSTNICYKSASLVVNHRGPNNTLKLNPQVLNGVKVSGPFHPLHFKILEVIANKPRSVGVKVVMLEGRVQS